MAASSVSPVRAPETTTAPLTTLDEPSADWMSDLPVPPQISADENARRIGALLEQGDREIAAGLGYDAAFISRESRAFLNRLDRQR